MTLANLIVKAAGLLFKIPLTAMIGEVGMGYYSGAYTLFTWLYMLLAAGLPAASSMLISRLPLSRRNSGGYKIFRVSMLVFVPIGLIGSASLLLGAEPISALMRIESSRLSIIAIAPTLFFICQSAALRGFFQGHGEFGWHSVSQVVEAIGKAALGVALAYRALKGGASIAEAAAQAALGITVGVALGMVVLYLAMIFRKREASKPAELSTRRVASDLIRAALPITLSSSVMSLTNLLDTFIMTRCLHASGLSQTETAAIYGNYTSLAVPMFNLPPVIVAPIAVSLLPTLSEALALGANERAKRLVSSALSITVIISVPCAIGLSSMSEPILSLFFADDIAARGAMPLTLLAPSSALVCLLGVTNVILQASGHERVPLFAMLFGALLKLLVSYSLTPYLRELATPISTFVCYFAVLAISIAAIASRTPIGAIMNLKLFIKPMIIGALAVLCAVLVYPILNGRLAVLLAIGCAGVVYLILTWIFSREVLNEFRR